MIRYGSSVRRNRSAPTVPLSSPVHVALYSWGFRDDPTAFSNLATTVVMHHAVIISRWQFWRRKRAITTSQNRTSGAYMPIRVIGGNLPAANRHIVCPFQEQGGKTARPGNFKAIRPATWTPFSTSLSLYLRTTGHPVRRSSSFCEENNNNNSSRITIKTKEKKEKNELLQQ